jgi:hypothetical protein
MINAAVNIAGQKTIKPVPIQLGAILYIPDLTTSINGYWVDKSGNNKLVQAATTTVINDSLIMPASDADIIVSLNLAGVYSIFYTNDSTPKKVKLSDLLQTYGTNFYFDEWNKRKMSLFDRSLDTNENSRMINFINWVDWLFPTGVIDFAQTIDFTKIFGRHQKN